MAMSSIQTKATLFTNQLKIIFKAHRGFTGRGMIVWDTIKPHVHVLRRVFECISFRAKATNLSVTHKNNPVCDSDWNLQQNPSFISDKHTHTKHQYMTSQDKKIHLTELNFKNKRKTYLSLSVHENNCIPNNSHIHLYHASGYRYRNVYALINIDS